MGLFPSELHQTTTTTMTTTTTTTTVPSSCQHQRSSSSFCHQQRLRHRNVLYYASYLQGLRLGFLQLLQCLLAELLAELLGLELLGLGLLLLLLLVTTTTKTTTTAAQLVAPNMGRYQYD
jgi:hypothetical protein